MTCQVCGATAPAGAQFCPNCGSPLATSLVTDERRMVTILFADLVDSTGLARRLDPERTREVLGAFYDAASEEIFALRGRPEKFIGDAVMAVFGVPQTNEDDALRAVRAGLAIRGRLRRLSQELALDPPLDVHVGVESGEAAAGAGPAAQLLITGPVVNAAARLQAAAVAGEILVGATARELTETAVSLGDARTVSAKGFDGDLVAFPVLGLTTRSARRTIPFVGRSEELALLRGSFARVRTSRTPLLCTVVGEPGIGKSRLLDEFIAGLDEDVRVLAGRSSPAADSATFAPITTIVRDAAGIDDADTPEKAQTRLRELVESAGDVAEPERTLERLYLLLGLGEQQREESAFIDEVQQGLTALIHGLGAQGPIALTFEDAHTLHAPMLDLIERLAARRRDGLHSAMVLVAARPNLLEDRRDWGTSAANHLLLRLESLADHEAVGLARQAGGARITEDEAASVAARAGGNPFFIVESTGMLIRLHEDGDVPATGHGPLPPTVQAMVAARLDALPAEQRDVARRLSAYLYSFDEAEAELVAGCARDQLEELVDAEIIVLDTLPAGPPTWRFRNDTFREVAYTSMPKRQRMTLHLAIADALEAEDRASWAADHLELAALASRDVDPNASEIPTRAADALVKRGDRARRRMENRAAITYYERALAVDDDDPMRCARTLAGIGEAWYWLAEYDEATGALDRAIAIGEEIGDNWTLAHAQRFRGDIAINVEADMDRAAELVDRGVTAAEALGDPWALARTLVFAGWVPWNRDDHAAADVVWRRALDIARGAGDRWAEVRALTSLSINEANQDHLDEATALIEQAQEVAEEMGDRFSTAVTITQHARLHEERQEWAEMVPDLDRAIAVFTDLGARWELADALLERGIARRELGLLDEAEDDLRLASRTSEELGERLLSQWTWRELARVAEQRGDRVEAAERFRRADEERARGPQ